MKRILMKTIFYLVKKKTNKKNLAPIYCRITVNGRRAEFSTGYTIFASEWRAGCCAETSPTNVLINAALSKHKASIDKIYFDLILKDKAVSADIIKQIFTGDRKQNYTFIDLVNEYCSFKFETITEYNTIKGYKARVSLIEEFLRAKKLMQVPPDWFTVKEAHGFLNHLMRVNRVSRNYANRAISFVKSVLNYGVANEILKFNPLGSIKLAHDKKKPIVALNKKELLKLTTKKFVSVRLQHVADLYVFQSFTGFAYADLVDFDYYLHVKKKEGKYWIFKHRVKSDVEAIIPLFPDALRILKKYNYKLPIISLQKYNSYLTEIVDIVGIDKKLTTHTARKTFAMVKLNEGFSIESVAKMLGHSGITITQSTYATVSHERIKTELQNLRA